MKNTEKTKLKIKDKVLIQDFNNQSIILNIDTGKYFEINNIGQRIIFLLKHKEHSIMTLVTELKKQYNSKELEKDVKSFIKSLLDLKILEER